MDAPFRHAGDLPRARRAVADVCRRLYERGYSVSIDGNVSVRVGRNRLLVTPSGVRKGEVKPADLVVCDERGRVIEGRGRPSSELGMHLSVYDQCPGVEAVVHAHPPASVAHSVAGVPIECLMPEVLAQLGEVVMLPYTTPGTDAVAGALRAALDGHYAFVLARHGTVTLGQSLGQAFDRLEVLEHAAQVSLMARALAPGAVQPLSASQRSGLQMVPGGA